MASRFEGTFRDRVTLAADRAFGVLVRFIRGVNVSDEFTARRNRRKDKAMGTDYEIKTAATMRDFVLPVTSVVIDGDTLEPRTGDRISEGTEVFEIQPPDGNTPSVELQTGGYDWLVRTKRVE